MARETRSLEKRRAILEAAAELFLRDGFANTSMDAITARAGVSKATVYAHFTSKDQLFQDLARTMTDEVLTGLPALVSGPDPLGDLEQFLSVLTTSAFSRGREWVRLAVAEAPRHPEVAGMIYQSGIARVRARLTEYFHQLIEQNRLRCDDPERAAQQLLGMIAMAPMLRVLLGVEFPEQYADAAFNLRPALEMFFRAYPIA